MNVWDELKLREARNECLARWFVLTPMLLGAVYLFWPVAVLLIIIGWSRG